MRLFNSRKRKVLTTFAVCFVTGIVSLALAAWLTDSNGTGRGQTGTIQKPIVTAGGSLPNGVLMPGGTGSGSFNVDIPNNVPLKIVSTGTHAPVIGVDNITTDYPAGNISAAEQPVNPPVVVQPGMNSGVVVPNAYRLASDAPNGCQSVAFVRGIKLFFETQ